MEAIHRRAALKLGAALGAGWRGISRAEALPPMAKVIVGFPPGGTPDLTARRMADQLMGKLAQAVIVDNRPGAGGRIAADVARQAPADGLTLLLNPSGMLVINPLIYSQLNYDPLTDFSPLSAAVMLDYGFAVGPAVPPEVKTLGDFAAWVRTGRTPVSYGSPAAGSPPHFVGDAVNRALALNMTHVPYRGGPPALNDLIGGQIGALVLNIAELLPNLRAGRLRMLATTGPARSRFTPQIPTFTEQKVEGLEHRDWFGVYIAGRPDPKVLAKVGPMVRQALSSKDYVLALNSAGLEAASSSAEELDQMARKDRKRWEPLIKATGFRAEA